MTFTQAALATAPTINTPTNFSMPQYTYYDSSLQVWRLQWTDTSTDEDGFQIYCRYGGAGGAITLYQTVPTALSLANVTTTDEAATVTCTSTTNLGVGWSVTGTNIPTGAVVASVTNSTTFVLSAAATGAASNLTLSAASAYQAASDYTYAMNMIVPSTVASGGFRGYWMEWWVVAYKGTPPTDYTNFNNVTNHSNFGTPVSFNGFPGDDWPTLTAPNGLTVTAPIAGQFHLAYTDNSVGESYFELDYKLHSDSTWSALSLDFNGTGNMGTGSRTIDLTGDPTQTTSTKLYLPNFTADTSYDFRLRAVGFTGSTSDFTTISTVTSQP